MKKTIIFILAAILSFTACKQSTNVNTPKTETDFHSPPTKKYKNFEWHRNIWSERNI